ncbi:MAG: hypothetical protein JST87_17805 [Bacteroidetes bacterium]|nr:hypothetical protein [Bacteroidota bacterium]MBS1933316.1 hypothetical protein [Bacteroidota bacterium]
MRINYFLVTILSVCVFSHSEAQYKRKGENLQNARKNRISQASFSLAQLKGKWQETIRKNRSDSSRIKFNDSILLKFYDSNKVQTRTSVATSLTLNGEAEIDGDNNLYVASDVYLVKSLSANELVIDDNSKFIHTLKKVDSFWYEKLGKLPVKQNEGDQPISVNSNSILGKWFVYRRQAKPGGIADSEQLIKYLNLPVRIDNVTASGDITFFRGSETQKLTCTVTLNKTEIRIISGKFAWKFFTYQADSTNLVFGDGHLKYFCKPLKEN